MAAPIPRWVFSGIASTRKKHLDCLGGCPVICGTGMQLSRCQKVFRAAICPRCKRTFYICRHCDRGHVYCCKVCSSLTRLKNCRVYRRRYRENEEVRQYLRDQERERRRRASVEKNRGDHTYEEGAQSARVSAPVRMAAALAVIGSVGGEEIQDDEVCCEFCGRRARFVYFGDGSTRQRKQGRVFRFSP